MSGFKLVNATDILDKLLLQSKEKSSYGYKQHSMWLKAALETAKLEVNIVEKNAIENQANKENNDSGNASIETNNSCNIKVQSTKKHEDFPRKEVSIKEDLPEHSKSDANKGSQKSSLKQEDVIEIMEDEDSEEEDIVPEDMKVKELKAELKKRGLICSGLKKDLIKRLGASLQEERAERKRRKLSAASRWARSAAQDQMQREEGGDAKVQSQEPDSDRHQHQNQSTLENDPSPEEENVSQKDSSNVVITKDAQEQEECLTQMETEETNVEAEECSMELETESTGERKEEHHASEESEMCVIVSSPNSKMPEEKVNCEVSDPVVAKSSPGKEDDDHAELEDMETVEEAPIDTAEGAFDSGEEVYTVQNASVMAGESVLPQAAASGESSSMMDSVEMHEEPQKSENTVMDHQPSPAKSFDKVQLEGKVVSNANQGDHSEVVQEDAQVTSSLNEEDAPEPAEEMPETSSKPSDHQAVQENGDASSSEDCTEKVEGREERLPSASESVADVAPPPSLTKQQDSSHEQEDGETSERDSTMTVPESAEKKKNERRLSPVSPSKKAKASEHKDTKFETEVVSGMDTTKAMEDVAPCVPDSPVIQTEGVDSTVTENWKSTGQEEKEDTAIEDKIQASVPQKTEKLSKVKSMVEKFNNKHKQSSKISEELHPRKKGLGLDALLAKKNADTNQVPREQIAQNQESNILPQRADIFGSTKMDNKRSTEALKERVKALSSAKKPRVDDTTALLNSNGNNDGKTDDMQLASPSKHHTPVDKGKSSKPTFQTPESSGKAKDNTSPGSVGSTYHTPQEDPTTHKLDEDGGNQPNDELPDDKEKATDAPKQLPNESKENKEPKNDVKPKMQKNEKRPLNLVGGLHSLTALVQNGNTTKSETQTTSSSVRRQKTVKVGALEKAKEAKRQAELKAEDRQRRKEELKRIREGKLAAVPSTQGQGTKPAVHHGAKIQHPTGGKRPAPGAVSANSEQSSKDSSSSGSSTVRQALEQKIQDKRKAIAQQRKEREQRQRIRLAEIRAEQQQRAKEMEEKQKLEAARIEEKKKREEEERRKKAEAEQQAKIAASKAQKQLKSEKTDPADCYDLSDREEDSDSEEIEEQRSKKHIPNWARGQELKEQLIRQFTEPIDPDSIFPETTSCNLTEIFRDANSKRKAKYNKRKSSGNWEQDKVSVVEKIGYQREMGFSK